MLGTHEEPLFSVRDREVTVSAGGEVKLGGGVEWEGGARAVDD